jgi:predicted RNase H-like nuclease
LRPALAATTHAEASALSRQCGGKGVSVQAWHLFARVRELDDFLGQERDWCDALVEVHPELSFLALNGDEPLSASKHRIDGIYRRRALIAEAFGWPAIESAVAQLAGTRVKEDDLLDAFAVLWSAERVAAGASVSLPADPPRDARGLPMRIVF